MILRRLLLAALVAFCAANAFGIGTYYGGYTWVNSLRKPLVPDWHVVDSYEVQKKCKAREGMWTNACAIYDERAGVCHVYASQSEFETPAWLRWHELLHCAGWDHIEP